MKNQIIPLISLTAGLMSSCIGAKGTAKETVKEVPNVIYIFPDQYRNMAMGF